MNAQNAGYLKEGIDSRALLMCFLKKIKYLLLIGVTGAVLGSGLYLLIMGINNLDPVYEKEMEFYVDFEDKNWEAKHHYNDYTWNDVIGTDLIMGEVMKVLGDDFLSSREEVKSMISAHIYSDVRYLTINVTGPVAAKVEAVSDALTKTLENFGQNMAEFDAISLIEDNQVQKHKVEYFSIRACLLGAVLAMLLASFVWAIDFCMGDAFYTKRDVNKALQIPALGVLFDKGNEADGKYEKELQLALSYLAKQVGEDKEKTSFVLVDVSKEALAENVKGLLETLYGDTLGCELATQIYPVTEEADFDQLRSTDGVLLVVPFGKRIRVTAEEMIMQLQNQDVKVSGVILAGADKKWMHGYSDK